MKKVFCILLVISLLLSCSTSSDVVSNNFLQKRKYQKGWFVNSSPQKFESKKEKKKRRSVLYRKSSVIVKSNVIVSEKSTLVVKEEISEKVNNRTLNTSFKEKKDGNGNSLVTLENVDIEVKNSVVLIFDIEQSRKGLNNVSLESPEEEYVPEEKEDRNLLIFLGIALLFLINIPPLSLWIGLGNSKHIGVNSLLYFLGIGFLLAALFSLLFTGLFVLGPMTINLFVVLAIVAAGLILASYVHALYHLIRAVDLDKL